MLFFNNKQRATNNSSQDHPPRRFAPPLRGWELEDITEAEWPESGHEAEPQNCGEVEQRNPCCEVEGQKNGPTLWQTYAKNCEM